MTRRARLVVFLCLSLLAPLAERAPALAEEEVVRIGVRLDCPPLSFINRKDQCVGFDADLARALCAELRLSCEISAHPFAELLPMLERGELDAVMAGLHITPERERFAAFSKPSYHSLFIYIGSPDIEETGFAGKRIGARKDSLEAEYVQRRWGSTAVPVIADRKTLLAGLRDGSIDIVLMDGLPGYAFLLSEAGRNLDVIGNAVPPSELEESARIAVHKKNSALRDKLDEALDNIRRNGEYDKISRIYFNYAIY